MVHAWVLVCGTCGNTELDFNYLEQCDNPNGNCSFYNIYCSKCENIGGVIGFTAGPIRLRAEKVREIKSKRERPDATENIGVKTTEKTSQNDQNKTK